MRTVHRILAAFAVLFALYISFTGLLVQSVDLQALLRHAPATSSTMQAIRVGEYGPPNFQVLQTADFQAAALPTDFNFDDALTTVMRSARTALQNYSIRYIEFRIADGQPIGRVESNEQLFNFNAVTGAALGTPSPVSSLPTTVERPGLRATLKTIHRWGGHWAYFIDVFFGTALCVMIATGIGIYIKLYKARARMGRLAPFWSAGGLWNTLHRAVAVSAAIFLTIVALSGTILAINALGVVTSLALHDGKRPGITGDFSSPLSDAELPVMLRTTLTAYRSDHPRDPIRVLRLRYFANMPQGVIITDGVEARQLVFNARTGQTTKLTEPGYPDPGLTFGWQIDQIVKRIHRGDYFGLAGRWMDLLTGLSLFYLSLSGVVMYFDRWSKRRKQGRRDFFWTDHKRAQAPLRENVSKAASRPNNSTEIRSSRAGSGELS